MFPTIIITLFFHNLILYITNVTPFPPVYTAWPGSTGVGVGVGVGSGFTYKVAPAASASVFVDSVVVVFAPIYKVLTKCLQWKKYFTFQINSKKTGSLDSPKWEFR